ncbi:hypothetical protein Acr_00g0051620 [Actinidia rufa]|uniref:Uncharacterized protein n=1 Tax=Actinidia rufa TaxID=165716 RepID=A0A7J0DME5_9ERIC|nr:hypothetical protein Acr_00g0051620 [Actinidia rufa]
MDVSVQYADPVKEDIFHKWELLWTNRKGGSSNVGRLVAELGSALEDALVLLSASNLPLEECGKVALPCSTDMLFCDVNVPAIGKDKVPKNTALDEESSLESGKSMRNSITSLPTSLRPISAMKGSREKNGLHVGKLSVNWAPDVYDPPPTSQSHTVKSQRQHYSMVNKKSYRHKHKAKSPQSSSVDKKKTA